jgi:hypothetical protein
LEELLWRMIWALMKEPAPSHRRSEGEDRAPVDKPRSTVSADELKDRRSRDDQSQAAEPPAWRVLLAYARPYRLTLIVGGLLSLATGVVVPRISRAASRTQESVGAMGTALERVLGAMRTVKASGAEQREAQRVDQAAAQVWQAGVRAAKWRRWPATPPGWPSRCRSSSCSAWGGARVASGAIDVGTLIAFLLYLYYLLPPMQGLVGAASQYQVGAAAVARIRQAEQLPVEPASAPAEPPRPGSAPAAVAFEQVRFRYRPELPEAHRGLSFTVPPRGGHRRRPRPRGRHPHRATEHRPAVRRVRRHPVPGRGRLSTAATTPRPAAQPGSSYCST